MITVKGAISALRSACFSTIAAEADALEPGGADVLLGHHLGHRGAGHAGDVAHAVDGDGQHRQGEVVEGRAVVGGRGGGAGEPLQPDHLAGEDHRQHHARDVFRRRGGADGDGRERAVLQRALAHAGEHAEQRAPTGPSPPSPRTSASPVSAEPRPEHLGDRARGTGSRCRSRPAPRRPATRRSAPAAGGCSRSGRARPRPAASVMRLPFCSLASLTRFGLRLTSANTISVRQSAVSTITPSRLSRNASIAGLRGSARPAAAGPGQGAQASSQVVSRWISKVGCMTRPVHVRGHVPEGRAPVGLHDDAGVLQDLLHLAPSARAARRRRRARRPRRAARRSSRVGEAGLVPGPPLR